MRMLMCEESILYPPTFTSVGDKETGIITASEFKKIHDEEQRQAHEKFVDSLIDEANRR